MAGMSTLPEEPDDFYSPQTKNTAHSCSFCRCDSSPMWIGCPCQFLVEHVFYFPCEANDPFLRNLGMHGFCLCRVCDGHSSVTAENLSLSQTQKWSNRATTDKVLIVWTGALAFFSLKVEWLWKGIGSVARTKLYYVEFNRSTSLKHMGGRTFDWCAWCTLWCHRCCTAEALWSRWEINRRKLWRNLMHCLGKTTCVDGVSAISSGETWVNCLMCLYHILCEGDFIFCGVHC